MLKKCLKYDFSATMRIWLLFSAIFLSVAVVAGFAISGLGNQNPIITILSALGILPGYIVLVAYPIATALVLCIRYYKNFFTDEAYLTFTLPVSRRTHVKSKLISAWCFSAMTTLVMVVGICITAGIYSLVTKDNVIGDFFGALGELSRGLVVDGGFHGVMILVMIPPAVFVTGVAGLIWNYFCITFGAMLAKRLKILAIILTFYISEMVINFVVSIVSILGTFTLTAMSLYLSELLSFGEQCAMVWLAILAAIAIVVIVAALLYRYIVGRLEKDLNLA